MRVTGWTVPEMRAAPSSVIRAHFERVYAELLWNPDLARAAARVPERGHYGSIRDYADARQAHARWVDAQQAIVKRLWPED